MLTGYSHENARLIGERRPSEEAVCERRTELFRVAQNRIIPHGSLGKCNGLRTDLLPAEEEATNLACEGICAFAARPSRRILEVEKSAEY